MLKEQLATVKRNISRMLFDDEAFGVLGNETAGDVDISEISGIGNIN